MVFATIILIVLAFTFEKPTTTNLNINNVSALLGLGVISTALVFSGYYILLKRAGLYFISGLPHPYFRSSCRNCFFTSEYSYDTDPRNLLSTPGAFLSKYSKTPNFITE